MPLFTIQEIDRDYRTWSGTEEREFPDLKAAEAWCAEHSWTGYDHPVDRRHYAPPPAPAVPNDDAYSGWC